MRVSQEGNRPLLLMVDEKKIHALPLNIETTCLPAQCCSVQIPVLACRDVPLSTQMEKDVKMPSIREKNGVRETVGTNSFRKSRNEKYPLDSNELLSIICSIFYSWIRTIGISLCS